MIMRLFCGLLIGFLLVSCKEHQKFDTKNAIPFVDETVIYADPQLRDVPVLEPKKASTFIACQTCNSVKNIEAKEFGKARLVRKVAVSNIVGDENFAYFLEKNGTLNSLDLNTNKSKKILKIKHNEEILNASLAFDGEFIYILIREGLLYKIDIKQGKISTTQEFNDMFTAPILIDGNELYLRSSAGNLYSINKADLGLKWKIDTGLRQTTYWSGAAPIVIDDVLISPTNSYKISWIQRELGEVLGEANFADFKQTSSVFDLEGIYAQPQVVMGNFILTNTQNELVLLAITNGAVLYRFEIPQISSLAKIGDFVLVSTLENKIFLVSLNTFTVKWIFDVQKHTNTLKETQKRLLFEPFVVGDAVYSLSNLGELIKLDLNTGDLKSIKYVLDVQTDNTKITKPPIILGERWIMPTNKFVLTLY